MQEEADLTGIGCDSYYAFRLNLSEYLDPDIVHKLFIIHKETSQGDETMKRLFLHSLNSFN